MKPNLPGLPTISALMLAAILTVWLGLWGPIELSKLEKWQTLIASFVALIAAGIAYRGATAKVRYDQEVAAKEALRQKLALLLKLEFALRQLIDKARGTKFMFASAIPGQTFSARDFDIEEPPELEEAWASLDIFPRHLIGEIRNVRNSLRKLAALKIELRDKTIRLNSDIADKPWMIDQGRELRDEIWHSAAVVVEDLEPLIQELAPEMDDSERLRRIHGEPGPDDFDEE